MSRRAALAVLLATLAVLASAACAHAGQGLLAVDETTDNLTLGFVGDGTAEFVTIAPSSDGAGYLLTGTVTPGNGCEAVAGGVLCRKPADRAGENATIAADLGAGDDRIDVDTSLGLHLVIVDGGAGNDTINAHGTLRGQDGNDTINVTGETLLNSIEGGRGDDSLKAGTGPATMIGGQGSDSLVGGRGNDLLVDVGETPGTDTFACGGGDDIVERDRGEAIANCKGKKGVDALARVTHKWAFTNTGLTAPLKLEMKLPEVGQSSLLTALLGEAGAACRGTGCAGGKFSTKLKDLDPPIVEFRLTKGGKRIPGTKLRGFTRGSKVIVAYRIEVGTVKLTKALVFTMRVGKIPRVQRACGLRKQGQSRDREIPCAA